MGYKVSYDGQVIDSLLDKSKAFESTNNAWIMIPSSNTKLNIEHLQRPGNYIYTGIVDFPEMDQVYGIRTPSKQAALSKTCSCMIFVRYMNHNIYQYFHMNSLIDYNDTVMVVAWIRQPNYEYIPKVFYNNEPSNAMMAIIDNESSDKGIHKLNKQIRIFKDSNKLKYYDSLSNSYQEFVNDSMDTKVYGKISDIFSHIDKTIPKFNFTDHLNDETIHINTIDKAKYDSSVSSDSINTSIESWKPELINKIRTDVSQIKPILDEVRNNLNLVSTSIPDHQKDLVKHPSQQKVEEWNSKSDSNHVHTIDQITIDTSNVVGSLSVDQIHPAAKERQVIVNTIDEMYKLTNTQIYNGYWVLVKNNGHPLYYIVIDDSKIGTAEAFKLLSTQKLNATWDNIRNKPSNMDSLGITDKMNNNIVDQKVTELNTAATNSTNAVNNISRTYTYSNAHYTEMTNSIESIIDLIDYKLKIIKSLITSSENM